MTSMIPFNAGNSQLPAHLQGQDLGVTSALLATVGAGGNRIGLKGSRFRIVVNGKEESVRDENYLDVIVVGAVPHVSRQYYEGEYDENTKASPTCYSADGVTPAEDVKRQVHTKCETCPMNQKGSKTVGTQKMKACSYFQRLVVILADDPEARAFKLDVKSQGLFGESHENVNKFSLKDYTKFVSNRGIGVEKIVTRLSFDTDASVPKLLFHPLGFVGADMFEAVKQSVASEEVKTLLKITMATVDLSSEVAADEAPVHTQQAPAGTPASTQTQAAPAPKPPVTEVAAPEPEAKRHFRAVTEKLDGFTVQQWLDSGWTREDLIADGKIVEVFPEPAKPAAPPSPPPKPAGPPKPPAKPIVEDVAPPAAAPARPASPPPKPTSTATAQPAVVETTTDGELEDIIAALG